MKSIQLIKGWLGMMALVKGTGTARGKPATGRQRIQSRRIARDGRQLAMRASEVGKSLEQLLCVWMLRIVINRFYIVVFGSYPAIHDQHSITHLGHYAQIVRNKQHRKP